MYHIAQTALGVACPLNIRPLGCLETSMNKLQSTIRNENLTDKLFRGQDIFFKPEL